MKKKMVLAAALLCLCVVWARAGEEFEVVLFQSPDRPAVLTAPSYRIPAIVRCGDGSLLAVADYRLRLSDIGTGSGASTSQLELHCRRSTDGGMTWTEPQTVCQRTTNRADWHYAMGDAALVADAESGDVLLLCAAGNVGYGASTAQRPIRIVGFRSHDCGQTWDEGTEMTSHIYGLYGGQATAIFITSGSMFQSRHIKVGSHRRIYAAHPIRTKSMGNSTCVIYSDDFGQTWNVLGTAGEFPDGTVHEEGKVAETPEGNVILMVRDDNGASDTALGKKNFNLFTYTDVATAQGQWSEAASGITGMANAQNSTLLLVPARRTADDRQVLVALVALPFHTVNKRDAVNNYGRKYVGFVYKEIGSAADYASGQALANGWAKGCQVSDTLSAYTDLVLLADGNIGLCSEDNGKQGQGTDGNKETEAYDIVFRSLQLQTITNGRYQTDLSHDGSGLLGICCPATAGPSMRMLRFDLLGRPARAHTSLLWRKIHQARAAMPTLMTSAKGKP